jgi:hypothetical protein
MANGGAAMTIQGWMWTADGIAAAVAVLAGVADWRRVHRRRGIDDIGWVPWRGIQVAAAFAVVALTILAWKAG